MLGYWNDPESTARTIRDGWLYTGDLATEDEDGFFRIVDRKKDLIITSGFNVYPSEVEPVLRGFPGVADVAVIGVPNRERGEIVKAVIVTKPGRTSSSASFGSYCDKHLAKHKRPRVIEITGGELPRNFLGQGLPKEIARSPRPLTNLSHGHLDRVLERFDEAAPAQGACWARRLPGSAGLARAQSERGGPHSRMGTVAQAA